MTANPSNATPPVRDVGAGNIFAFEAISAPGAYICNWSGHLLRVPEDAVLRGRSPVLEIRAKEPLYVTKLSEDPFVTVTKARMIAGDLDQHVNF